MAGDDMAGYDMAGYDFRTPRLFVEADLAQGAHVPLGRAQATYLLNVMRLKDGASVLLFNGRDGEWGAQLAQEGRKAASLTCRTLLRPQDRPSGLLYAFAPLKHARLD